MEERVAKSRFKAHALEYFRRVQETGEPIIMTDRGRPVLRVVPYMSGADDLLRILRGSVIAYDRPTEPIESEAWESLR